MDYIILQCHQSPRRRSEEIIDLTWNEPLLLLALRSCGILCIRNRVLCVSWCTFVFYRRLVSPDVQMAAYRDGEWEFYGVRTVKFYSCRIDGIGGGSSEWVSCGSFSHDEIKLSRPWRILSM